MRPLTFQPTPRFDETIASIIQRTADANLMTSVSSIFTAVQLGPIQNLYALHSAENDDWIRRLAALTGVSEAALRSGRRRESRYWSLRTGVWSVIERSMTYCTACLEEDMAWRVHWLCPYTVACERHDLRLTDHFEVCRYPRQARRRWFMGHGPVLDCGARQCVPLLRSPSVAIDRGVLNAQRRLSIADTGPEPGAVELRDDGRSTRVERQRNGSVLLSGPLSLTRMEAALCSFPS